MTATEYRDVTVTETGEVSGETSISLGGPTLWVPFQARLDLFLIDESDIDTGCDDWSEIRDSEPCDLVDLVEAAQRVLPVPVLAARLGVPAERVEEALGYLTGA